MIVFYVGVKLLAGHCTHNPRPLRSRDRTAVLSSSWEQAPGLLSRFIDSQPFAGSSSTTIAASTDAVDVVSRWNCGIDPRIPRPRVPFKAGFFLKEISAIQMAPAISSFQHTVQKYSGGGCRLAPKPASRTRPRRIRPSRQHLLPYPCGASANRKAKRFEIGLAV